MKITSDWHIHSDNSCDGACMRVATLIARAREKGVEDFGLTDHIHTPYNLPDLEASRREFLENEPSDRFHFGVEVSVVSQWELDEVATGRYDAPVYGLREGGPAWAEPALGLTAEDVERLGIEYVVGGTHWPLYVPVTPENVTRDYHRQNMFLACHPLVDIVAHPWWWHGAWKGADGHFTGDPWFDDFGRIPQSMHDEFAAAAVEHDTAIEINVGAMVHNYLYPERFREQYMAYLAGLKERGATLAIGSDCHDDNYRCDFDAAAPILESVGITDADLWRLPPREKARD